MSPSSKLHSYSRSPAWLGGLILCLSAWSVACTVTAVEPTTESGAVNECSGDSDCPGGICHNDRCEATEGDFSTVLLHVTVPPSGPDDVAGIEYVRRIDQLDLSGGPRDIELEPVAHVTGTVTIEPYQVGTSATDLCQLVFSGSEDPNNKVLGAVDNSIPVSVSFTPSDRMLGLAATTYASGVDTTLIESTTPVSVESMSFDIGVPPGEYDIYLQPRAPAEGGCDIPPHLLRRVQVTQPDPSKLLNFGLKVPLPPPASFALTIQWPVGSSGKTLDGWTVDMLDPVTGRVISTRAVLANPQAMGTSVSYETRIFYAPVELEATESELVRLSPPKGVDAPTIVLSRSVLELFSQGTGVIDQFVGYPEPVEVAGQVTLAGDATPAAATVTLVATSLQGVGDGVFASFQRTVEADADGNFDVTLLPGTYRVYAMPSTSGVTTDGNTVTRGAAATVTDWEIAATPASQAGKVVELLPVTHLTGTALVPGGAPAVGSLVTAVPSPREVQVDLLTRAAQGEFPFAPTAQSSLVGSNGEFDVQADPGDFAVSVRPPEDSGYPWYVSQASVVPVVNAADQQKDIGNFILPLPVPYSGRVLVPAVGSTDTAVSEALIRAYVYLDDDNRYTDDPTKAVSVVQIGETRADGSGNFELLIPANLY